MDLESVAVAVRSESEAQYLRDPMRMTTWTDLSMRASTSGLSKANGRVSKIRRKSLRTKARVLFILGGQATLDVGWLGLHNHKLDTGPVCTENSIRHGRRDRTA